LGARSAAQAGLVGPNEPRSIDFDGDGHTSAREIGAANRIERRSQHHAAQYDLADNEFPIAAEDYTGWMPLFDASDENGDGLMDIDEFEGFYYDTLFEWNRLDTNGDNAISAAEFDGSPELFNEFDHIPNGLLDKAEFRRGRAILLQRAAQGG